MSWINLVSSRHRLQASAAEELSEWERATRLRPGALTPVLHSLIGGDEALVKRALALAPKLVATFYVGFDDADLVAPAALSNLAGLSVAAHVAGDDQSTLWNRIVAAPPPRDPTMRALQAIVSRLLRPSGPSSEVVRSKKGAVRSVSDWLRRLVRSPLRQSFDLSASPDHPLWPYDLESFVLPLGFLLHRELHAQGHETSLLDLFRLGAWPERHPHVLYERQHPRPPTVSIPDPNEPSTWFGFDALEVHEDGLRAYHYLGFTWQAPLLFRDDLNAFRFLEHLDSSWTLVREALAPEEWMNVEQRRKRGGCTHVIVYDKNEATVPKSDLARAGAHYGLSLEARDVTEV